MLMFDGMLVGSESLFERGWGRLAFRLLELRPIDVRARSTAALPTEVS
jgi:hypothetical protein